MYKQPVDIGQEEKMLEEMVTLFSQLPEESQDIILSEAVNLLLGGESSLADPA